MALCNEMMKWFLLEMGEELYSGIDVGSAFGQLPFEW